MKKHESKKVFVKKPRHRHRFGVARDVANKLSVRYHERLEMWNIYLKAAAISGFIAFAIWVFPAILLVVALSLPCPWRGIVMWGFIFSLAACVGVVNPEGRAG